MNLRYIPDDWAMTQLRNLCLQSYLTNPAQRPDKPFIYVDVSSVSNTAFCIVEANEILGRDAPSRARKLIRTGDILFATVRPTLRRIALVPPELDEQVCSTGFCVVRADPKRMLPEYAYFFLLTEEVVARVEAMQKGATYPAISDAELLSIPIPLPPLPEQRAIARVLRAVQAAREARQREAALERERKAALMDYLFTHGTRGEATKQTPIGEMPESWEVVELGQLITEGPQNGIYKHSSLYGEGAPILRIDDFDNDGCFVSLSLDRLRLSSEEVDRYRLNEGDLVINRVNSLSHLGKCALIPKFTEATVFESNMMRFRIDETLTRPEYVFRLISRPRSRDHIRGMARRAVAQSSINQGDVKSFVAPLPSIGEQIEIANTLTACDAKIAALDRESALLDELFRALLEELMSGRVAVRRLIDEGET